MESPFFFKKANLAFDCEKVPLSLPRPHVTGRVELELPVTFPLKDEYEKLNGALEGMNTIDDRGGRPDVDDMFEVMIMRMMMVMAIMHPPR